MTSKDSGRALRAARQLIARCVLFVPLLGAGACVMGSDSDPPMLSVDLYWDTERRSERTCSSARVSAMAFRLLDAEGEVLAENSPDDEYQGASRCVNGIDFPDLALGEYTLELTGFDADHNPAWSVTCDLYLDRFDRLFECIIERVSTDEPAS